MGMNLTKEFVNSCRKVGVLRDFLCQAIDQVDEKDKEIAELQDQCMSCPVKMQDDDVVAEKDNEIRRLKRALYKALANWAHFAVAFFSSFKTKDKWHKMEHKCLKKAEEYK